MDAWLPILVAIVGAIGALFTMRFSKPRSFPSLRRKSTRQISEEWQPEPDEDEEKSRRERETRLDEERYRRQRQKDHRNALRDWDMKFIAATPQAERDAMNALYRRQYPRLVAERRLEDGDTKEVDLSTPEGMALAELLEAEEERTYHLRTGLRRRQDGA